MRVISVPLSAHLSEEVTTLATCWRLLRRDGVMLGFTTHDRDLEIDGALYHSRSSFHPSSILSTGQLNVDNLEVAGALDSHALSKADLLEGRLDFAQVDIFLVNWADLSTGKINLRSGVLGEIRFRDGAFTAELRGLKQALQQPIGEVYSPECRADLGDLRCRVALRDFTQSGAVIAVTSAASFTASLGQGDGWFRYGVLRWHTGANSGLDFEVKNDIAGEITLIATPPKAITPGDTFDIQAGCDKRFATCRDKFNNAVNFRGEPFVPGVDSLLNYPGLR